MSLQEQPGGPDFDGGPIAFNGLTYNDGAAPNPPWVGNPPKQTTQIEYATKWRFYTLDGGSHEDRWVLGPTEYVTQPVSGGPATAVRPVTPGKPEPTANYQDPVVIAMNVRGRLADNTHTSVKSYAAAPEGMALTSAVAETDSNGALTGDATEAPWDSGL